jgi:lanosterol synthase
MPGRPPPEPAAEVAPAAPALEWLVSRQQENGCWEGEVVWCPMLAAQYVIAQRILGRSLDAATVEGIIRHFQVTQTSEGGWGLHLESPPYLYVTTLVYVALRLLGVAADDPTAAAARGWLRQHPEGVVAIPTWGKFWLALAGLYEYEGMNPCPPELFLAPAWLPFHPFRMYCHTRYIYLGIACLYGMRFRGDLGPIAADLRRELYRQPYESVNFAAHRHQVAASDAFQRPGGTLRLALDALRWARVLLAPWRRRALEYCFERILYEQRASRYQGLSPVNALLNCLAIAARDRRHPELAPSLAGLEAWRWQDETEGLRYAGARSQTWDTAFAMQAILEWPEQAAAHDRAVRQGLQFLRAAQITAELPDHRREHRQAAFGGWCFSDGQHRWPVCDCTAEALAAIRRADPDAAVIPRELLHAAAAFILDRQNQDGGFSTYEKRRTGAWLERLNPAEMFAGSMVEHSYLECTASAIKGLARVRGICPPPLQQRIDGAIERGVAYLRRQQRADGSFAGSWGIQFTYGIFMAVEGLRAAGVSPDDPALARAGEWLKRHQRADGGWGEHWTGCLRDEYVEHPHSQVVMTSWALLALLEIAGPCDPGVVRGIVWLQKAPPQRTVNGMFFRTAMLEYRLYDTYFPAWALARWERLRRTT